MQQILLENATNILLHNATRFSSLLQNASGYLLQNTTVLLKFLTVITKCVNLIKECDSYYRMRHLLQSPSVNFMSLIFFY